MAQILILLQTRSIMETILYLKLLKNFLKKGKIGIKNNNEIKILHGPSRHISFPSHIYLKKENKNLFFPEIASWSNPKLFEIKKK